MHATYIYDERTLYNFIRPRACCGLVSVAGSFFVLYDKTKVSRKSGNPKRVIDGIKKDSKSHINYCTMRKETKENIQYSTAVGMLVLGASLAVAGFVCSEPMGQIHDSVLWLFAQCLLYAGSVFGISIYINSRFNNLIEQLKEKEGKK